MDLFQCFDRVVVINLPERKDRRRDMQRQFRFAGVSIDEVEFFPAVRSSTLGDWPNLGSHGCYLSHYNVLRTALESGIRSIAILEDDCDFQPCFPSVQRQVSEDLRARDWGIVYFGHLAPAPAQPTTGLHPCTLGLQSHFYAVHGCVMRRLVDFLELVLSRPAGHPLGGRQYIDGALAMFRQQNPDVPILLAFPNLGIQRSSRSDIHPRWFDKVPGVKGLVNELRRLPVRSRNR